MLDGLQHRHQRQQSRGEGRLPGRWVQVGEVLVAKDLGIFFSEAAQQVLRRIDLLCDLSGVLRDGRQRLGLEAHGGAPFCVLSLQNT